MKEPGGVDKRSGSDADGFYIRTFTGRKLYWDRVEEHDYCIEDIAHALAMKCRWSGHTSRFYSVAQHCEITSHLVDRPHRLAALLHDASEAYMPDFPSPLKWYLLSRGFTELQLIEKRVDQAIAKKFLIPWPRDPSVKVADIIMLGSESRDLMPAGQEQQYMSECLDYTIEPYGPATAEESFLSRYGQIIGEKL